MPKGWGEDAKRREQTHPFWPPLSLRYHCWVDVGFAGKILGGFISLSITYHKILRLFWPPISEKWHNTLAFPEQI